MKQQMERWRKEPIVVPRWALVLMYSGFIVLGVVGALAGIPTIDDTTDQSWVTWYSLGIISCSAVALAGASSEKLETVETIGSLLLFCLLTSYSGGAVALAGGGDFDRAAFGVVLCMMTFAPALRGLSLGKRHILAWAIGRRRNAAS